MKRSTARWTTAFAAAALIGVPAAGWSQTPPAATSQPPAAQQPADAPAQHSAAAEHIQKAEAALNDIPTSTLPARAKSRVAELKRHLNSLEKSAASSQAAEYDRAKPSSKPKDTWAKDVAAIDKTLTELLGPAAASGAAAPPAATGTDWSVEIRNADDRRHDEGEVAGSASARDRLCHVDVRSGLELAERAVFGTVAGAGGRSGGPGAGGIAHADCRVHASGKCKRAECAVRGRGAVAGGILRGAR